MEANSIREFFKKDVFATEICGIEIDKVEGTQAVCSMIITPSHHNAVGQVQGGAIFTLGDFTFAVAANTKEQEVVSLDNQITYMSRTKGKKLIATAYQVSTTRKVCFYQVDIADELGNKVAIMSVTGYYI